MINSPRRPVHILLVEDDEDHADLIQRALCENQGDHCVSHVFNGEDAIAFVRRTGSHAAAERPDVILLDLNLPRKSGHEVLEEIKHDPDLRSIPVVVLTTSRADVDRERAYTAHVNSYLVKPLDLGKLDEMIRQLKTYWTVWNEPPV